jgi:glycine/D-amino acid oxidase-like deaminating enzyme
MSSVTVDDNYPYTGSRASSGILNPVMGRKRLPVPDLLHLLPAAIETYRKIEQLLGIPLLHSIVLTDVHVTQEEAEFFRERAEALPEYLAVPSDDGERWHRYFQVPFGTGETEGAWLLDVSSFLQGWNSYLKEKQAIISARWEADTYNINEDGVVWNDIHAKKLIYCSGSGAFSDPLFKSLPLSSNKGEALIIDIETDLPRDRVYKRGMGLTLAPWKERLWWAGASSEWQYESVLPTASYRQYMESQLKSWLREPFTILDHISGERPTSLDRRPIVGLHPQRQNVGVLNGMGTKGVLQAPYYATQLANHLAYGKPLDNSTDLVRYQRALLR